MGKVCITFVPEAKANIEHNVFAATCERVRSLYVGMGVWHIDALMEAFETHAG